MLPAEHRQGLQPPRPATGVSRGGPEVFRECPSGCFLGPFGPQKHRSVQKVSPECPESVPGVSGHLLDTPGNSRDTFWTLRSPGPKGPRDTPRDTPGTLRARRARETPVAGRGGRKARDRTRSIWTLSCTCMDRNGPRKSRTPYPLKQKHKQEEHLQNHLKFSMT